MPCSGINVCDSPWSLPAHLRCACTPSPKASCQTSTIQWCCPGAKPSERPVARMLQRVPAADLRATHLAIHRIHSEPEFWQRAASNIHVLPSPRLQRGVLLQQASQVLDKGFQVCQRVGQQRQAQTTEGSCCTLRHAALRRCLWPCWACSHALTVLLLSCQCHHLPAGNAGAHDPVAPSALQVGKDHALEDEDIVQVIKKI
jgi:hypothetical protein